MSLKISVNLKLFFSSISLTTAEIFRIKLASVSRKRFGVELIRFKKLFPIKTKFCSLSGSQFFQMRLLVSCLGQCGEYTRVRLSSIATFPSRFWRKTSHWTFFRMFDSPLEIIGSWNVASGMLNDFLMARINASWWRDIEHELKWPIPKQIIWLNVRLFVVSWASWIFRRQVLKYSDVSMSSWVSVSLLENEKIGVLVFFIDWKGDPGLSSCKIWRVVVLSLIERIS